MTDAPLAAQYHCHNVSLRRAAAAERSVEQRRKRSYTVLLAATQKAVYSQSEHLAACNQHHLKIADDSAVKQRLKRDAELSERRCPT